MSEDAVETLRVAVAVRASAQVGEGPVWDATTARLDWVDIPAGLVHTSDIETGRTATRRLPTQVGAVTRSVGGGYVVACKEGFGAFSPDGDFTVRHAVLGADERMNDAKCDPAGRFWAGSTMLDFRAGRGALHVLRPDWSIEVVRDGLTLPNGMGWSPDARTFYLADSYAYAIYTFSFDLAGGTLSDERTLVEFTEADGMPDGLCVDTDGCLWVAMWGGARVLRISPTGDVLSVVAMPVRQPSSCAFAGDDLDVLCVTSARDGLDLGADAPDGSVFRVSGTGAVGLPQAHFGATR